MKQSDLSSDFVPVSESKDIVSVLSPAGGTESSFAALLPAISDFSRLERLPSEGSTCLTYKWIWDSRVYFVKRLKSEFIGSPRHISAFEKEFELGCRLSHPSLPRYVAYHHSLHECYIVTEYIDGRTLDTLWHQRITADRRVTYKVMRQLVDVLDYLHRNNIMHYDLIPKNVMLTNGLDNVVLIDLDKAFNSAYYNSSGDPRRFGIDADSGASADVDFRGVGLILARGFWGGMADGELRHFHDLCNRPGVTAEELREALEHTYDDVYVSDRVLVRGRTCDAFMGDWQQHPVIIKRLKPELLDNKYYIDSLRREYEIMNDLGDATFAYYNLMRIKPDECYVVIEQPEGISVARMLSEEHPWIYETENIKHLLRTLLDAFFFLWGEEGLDHLRFGIEDIFVNHTNGAITIANFREILDTTISRTEGRMTQTEVQTVNSETQEIVSKFEFRIPNRTLPFELPQLYHIIDQLETNLDLYWLRDFKKGCLDGASYRKLSAILERATPY